MENGTVDLKNKLTKEEESLHEKERQVEAELNAADTLVSEGSDKLQAAISDGKIDPAGASVASLMLQGWGGGLDNGQDQALSMLF